MAAPEVRFEALGQAWRFRFGFGALCALEEEFDQPFMLILARCFPEIGLAAADEATIMAARVRVRAGDLAGILVAGLSENHPGITRAQVAEIVDDIGLEKVAEILRSVVAADIAGKDGGKNPPKRGRRPGSTRTGSSAPGSKRG